VFDSGIPIIIKAISGVCRRDSLYFMATKVLHAFLGTARRTLQNSVFPQKPDVVRPTIR